MNEHLLLSHSPMHDLNHQPRRCQFTLNAPSQKIFLDSYKPIKKIPHSKAPMLGSRAGRMKIDENPFPLKPGGQSAVVPPGPVPNPEVKRCRANGSRTIGPARVGRRRDFFPSGPASLQTRGACSLLALSFAVFLKLLLVIILTLFLVRICNSCM